jgi:hypothetical protein
MIAIFYNQGQNLAFLLQLPPKLTKITILVAQQKLLRYRNWNIQNCSSHFLVDLGYCVLLKFNLWLWWPSLIEGEVTRHNFERGPSKCRSSQFCFNFVKWFLKRRFSNDFSITLSLNCILVIISKITQFTEEPWIHFKRYIISIYVLAYSHIQNEDIMAILRYLYF